MRLTRSIVALAVVLAAGAVPVTGLAAEEPDFEVQAGARSPENPDAPYEYTRYYPEVLRIHRNQTVRFTFAGFHTITFFGSEGREAFLRPDELPGQFAFNESTWTNSEGCGGPGAAACVVSDPGAYVSSGTPLVNESWSASFDLPVGTTSDYFCAIHSSMKGTIQIAPDAEPLKSKAQIASEIAQQIQEDTDAADALLLENSSPSFRVEDGRKIWRVRTGDSTADNHVGIAQFMPATLDVGAGDLVEFEFDDDVIDEIHTVSFPLEAVGEGPGNPGLVLGFYPACDLDGITTGLPGIPGPWPPFAPGPPCPGAIEVGVAPWMTESHPAPGDAVVTPATYHDSGILAPPSAPDEVYRIPGTDERFPSRFEASFPVPGQFRYGCTVHGAAVMGADITVS